ncbi:MAG: phosphate/phosphite/phosphonate ABC transporter substrate-binding protein [Thermaerobacter sp.]|nr:phosphate/phosphite/phosphonate ABC transporter substrate-binding protein [Thermaerobacter sp.]
MALSRWKSMLVPVAFAVVPSALLLIGLSAWPWPAALLVLVLVAAYLAGRPAAPPAQKPGGDLDRLQQAVRRMSSGMRQVSTTSRVLVSSAEEAAQSTEQAGRHVQDNLKEVMAGGEARDRSIEEATSSLRELEQAIHQIAAGAQEQAQNVSHTAEIINQMAQAIEDIAANAQRVAAASTEMAEQAGKGGQAVERTVEGMDQIQRTVYASAERIRELGQRSQQIGDIIQVISDIADQTNLLALNAAIEAARAGEHGKGFAVVASEVRKLAERSSKATKEIRDLIESIQGGTRAAVESMEQGTREVRQGSDLVHSAGATLQEIITTTRATDDQVRSISAAAEELAASSTEVVQAIESLASASEEYTAATEEMSAGSSEAIRAVHSIAEVSRHNATLLSEVLSSTAKMTTTTEELTLSTRSMAESLAGMVHEVQKVLDDLEGNGRKNAQTVRFSTIGLQRADIMAKSFQPLMDYLSEQTGFRVEFVPSSSYDHVVESLAKAEVDIAQLSPFMYVQAADQRGIRALVKPLNRGQPYYYANLVARGDSALAAPGDIRGKRFAFGDRNSTSGHFVPRLLLQQAGIDPERDCAEVRFLGSHDNVAEAVLNGTVDAGGIEDVVLERYKGKGAGFKILATSEPILQFPWAVRPGMDQAVAQSLREAFLALRDPDVVAAMQSVSGGFSGFAPADDKEYDFFRDLRRKLKV